jgi:aryl-phospho-beta-D-glucosidase BglC (GH1 family)
MRINFYLKLRLTILLSCILSIVYAQTPVDKNGQLKVCGTKLCNQYNNPIQLRGMSTHGIQWHGWGECLTESSLNTLATEWGADILRISMYIQEDGYEENPTAFTNQVKTLVNEATERGMYALIDFHQLNPGDPNFNTEHAKTFFTAVANEFKNYNNVIYDICNEPNGVGWNTIRNYATQVIPVIRAIDNDAVILVGTHGWSTFGVSGNGTLQDVINNPLPYSNVMYTFHFYAASHGTTYLNMLDQASNALPVFVTEFGAQQASGDGANNFTMAQQYIDLMHTKKISWCNWNYSDDPLTGAVWEEGTCPNGPWTTGNLKEAGSWIRGKMLNPADNFPGADNFPPAAPSNLVGTGSASMVNLSWKDNSNNEVNFIIERSTNGSTWTTTSMVLNPNSTSISITVLPGSTPYFYRIRAKNTIGSSFSNVVGPLPSTVTTSPVAPSNLVATATSSSQIKLSWNDNSNNESSFKIERSLNGNTGWSLVINTQANIVTYANTGLSAATKYYYRISAINAIGSSSFSTANATTQNTSGNSCAGIPQFVQGGSYVDGSEVQNAGGKYKCKPWPYTGWCTMGGSFTPGTGTDWQQAWIFVGSCSAGRMIQNDETANSNTVELFPTLVSQGAKQKVKLTFEQNQSNVRIEFTTINGMKVFEKNISQPTANEIDVELPVLTEGLYLVKIQNSGKTWVKKYWIVKQN